MAVVSAVVLLLSYVVKEILKENLKEFNDSLAFAEAQFRTELDRSAISVQILNVQLQIENLKPQKGRGDTHLDYSALIAQDIPLAQQAKAHLDADFDSVSRLIDKFPSGASDLRNLRDQARQQVEWVDKQMEEMLKPNPKHDVGRFVEVKGAMLMALIEELPVAVLGDVTLTAAERVQEAAKRLIRLCKWIMYFLFFLESALAIYAGYSGMGIKTELAE